MGSDTSRFKDEFQSGSLGKCAPYLKRKGSTGMKQHVPDIILLCYWLDLKLSHAQRIDDNGCSLLPRFDILGVVFKVMEVLPDVRHTRATCSWHKGISGPD